MLGAKIRNYIDENGIKMTFLAEKAGLPYSVIVDICNKDRKIDVVEYYKICKALGVPFETFLEEKE